MYIIIMLGFSALYMGLNYFTFIFELELPKSLINEWICFVKILAVNHFLCSYFLFLIVETDEIKLKIYYS
jgi:hypothetical protein